MEAIRVACALFRLLRLAVIVPEIIPPGFDLDPDGLIFEVIVELVGGIVDVLVGFAGLRLDLGFGFLLAEILDLALGDTDLTVGELIVEVRLGLNVTGDAVELVDVPDGFLAVAGHLLDVVDHRLVVRVEGLVHLSEGGGAFFGGLLLEYVTLSHLERALVHLLEVAVVLLALLVAPAEAGVAVLDGLLEGRIGLGELGHALTVGHERIVHGVRVVNESLGLVGGGLGRRLHAVEAVDMLVLGIHGRLDSRGNLAHHPANVVLGFEVIDAEDPCRLLQLGLSLIKVLHENVLTNASLSGGISETVERLVDSGEVSLTNASHGLVHTLELASHGIPLGVAEETEQSVDLGVELGHLLVGSAGALGHELHGRADIVDVLGAGAQPARLSPRTERALAALGLEEAVEVRLGRLGGDFHSPECGVKVLDIIDGRFKVDLVRDAFHCRQRTDHGNDASRRPRHRAQRAKEPSDSSAGVGEASLRPLERLVDLAQRPVRVPDRSAHAGEAAEELAEDTDGVLLAVHRPQLERVESTAQRRDGKVKSTLELAECERTGAHDERGLLHPHRELRELLDQGADELNDPGNGVD